MLVSSLLQAPQPQADRAHLQRALLRGSHARVLQRLTLPGFADIHPFAPADQTRGYLTLIERLQSWLCTATGFAAVSLQPNAGSQGEYAGLLVIRAWHESRGEPHVTFGCIPRAAPYVRIPCAGSARARRAATGGRVGSRTWQLYTDEFG